MFKKEFQGGPFVEVFSAQGKDPTAQWRLTGASNIRKEFDRSVKSFVFVIDGAVASTKMQLPKDSKTSLALTQRFLVLQLFIPRGQDVSVDLGVHDSKHCKRRLLFSTAHKETQTTPLHSKIPLNFVKRDMWSNLVLDLASLVSDTWRGQSYASLESICLSASCRLRRVFTMRAQPPDTSDDGELLGLTETNGAEVESIPKQCQLAPDVPQLTQVVTVKKILHHEGKGPLAESTGKPPTSSSSEDLNSSGGRKGTADAYHIAFGTKIVGQPKVSKEVSSSKGKSEHSRTRPSKEASLGGARTQGGARVRSAEARVATATALRHDADKDAVDVAVDKESLRGSKTWTDGADVATGGGDGVVPFVRPHPPRSAGRAPGDAAAAARPRRKPRVKSAGKERTLHAGSTDDRVVRSQPSSRHNSVSDSGSGGAALVPAPAHRAETRRDAAPTVAPPRIVASDAEVADILTAMQQSVRRSWQKTDGSESDGASPLPASGGADADESISDVIDALRGTVLSSGGKSSSAAPREYEDSEDEDDVELIEDRVYLFSSPPKSAPRHMTNNYMSSSITGPPQHRQQRKAKPETKPPPEPAPDKASGNRTSDYDSSGSHLTSSQRDFWWDPRESCDTESAPVAPAGGAMPRPTHTAGPATSRAADDAIVRESSRYPYPHAVGDGGPVPAGYSGPLPGGGATAPETRDGVGRQPRAGAGHTPGSSQTRQSISRKSLREIPPNDIRLSQTQKPYNVANYQMEDLSESFETKMLQELKQQAMQGSVEGDEDAAPRRRSRSTAPQQQRHRDQRLHYTDSGSDGEGDASATPLSTHRSQASSRPDGVTHRSQDYYAQQPHNYQDEMNLASARLKQSEMLNQSNPREWGNVYSPPIVLTSDVSESSQSQLSPGFLPPVAPPHGSQHHQLSPGQPDGVGVGVGGASPSGVSPGGAADHTDSEEELDLFYDAVLNCYFDPRTHRYYELRLDNT